MVNNKDFIQTEPSKRLVSIGLPVYNGESFLARALDSLLSQKHSQFELIISDNNSTDGTREICEIYAAKDDRIRYHRNETNIGAVKNFNSLLEMAKGTYFMWAAYDDLWEPSFVSELVALLEMNPDAILAFCSCNRMEPNGNLIHAHKRYGRLGGTNTLLRAQRYIWFPDGEGRAMLTYGLMRIAALKKVEGIKVYSLFECADDVMILRLTFTGEFVFSDSILFNKYDMPGSPSFVKWGFRERFIYYRDYRRIVLESELPGVEKIMLVISITVRQVLYQLGKPPYHFLLFLRKRLMNKS